MRDMNPPNLTRNLTLSSCLPRGHTIKVHLCSYSVEYWPKQFHGGKSSYPWLFFSSSPTNYWSSILTPWDGKYNLTVIPHRRRLRVWNSQRNFLILLPKNSASDASSTYLLTLSKCTQYFPVSSELIILNNLVRLVPKSYSGRKFLGWRIISRSLKTLKTFVHWEKIRKMLKYNSRDVNFIIIICL